MSEVQHHWHRPTQGQVTKALYQYLNDNGFTKQKLEEIVDKKIEAIVAAKIQKIFEGEEFCKIVVGAVSNYATSQKDLYKHNIIGRLTYLIEDRLKKVLLDDYEIVVRKK